MGNAGPRPPSRYNCRGDFCRSPSRREHMRSTHSRSPRFTTASLIVPVVAFAGVLGCHTPDDQAPDTDGAESSLELGTAAQALESDQVPNNFPIINAAG